MRRIETLLVANRGEIARRIFRTARDMGIGTVAVYSDPDAGSPHVLEADVAIPLGGATSIETYLDIGKILAAAGLAGADAVHPGYGFLAENTAFAQAVLDAGLTWVGPPPGAIATMGDKLTALDIMQAAGVPTLPRAEVGSQEASLLHERGRSVGYPLLVKASAGGGGKGMRIVRAPEDLPESVAAARGESARAFGSDLVFLERFLDHARHVEIQVFGDKHGNAGHLFERECSIQRRHQKIIEEAPSPFLTRELREDMAAAAVAAAKAVGYESAGTVEFVVGQDGTFYFLEMNTRLQVEHPVTEFVTGLDLVRLQVLIAEEERLDLSGVELAGHAIEARLYAEDPENGFLPSSGNLVRWMEPEGARFDSGVAEGGEVTVHYDPMLAKVIVHAPTREEAAHRLARALSELRVHGVTTNRDFLVNVLRHPSFLAGDTTTDFIDRIRPPLGVVHPPEVVRRAAIQAALAARAARVRTSVRKPAIPPGWRNNRSTGETTEYEREDALLEVSFWERRDGSVAGTAGGSAFEGRVYGWSDPWLDALVEGVRQRVTVTQSGGMVWVQGPDGEVRLTERPRFPSPLKAAVAGGLIAPMNGLVLSVGVAPGDRVTTGQALVVIEAMKMEHRVDAPADGTVSEVLVAAGAAVAADQLLVVVEPDQAVVPPSE